MTHATNDSRLTTSHDSSHNHLSYFLKHIALIIAFCLVSYGTASAGTVTLPSSENYTANNGDTLTGSTTGTVTITSGATITLSGATIGGGIICAGNATIILEGVNSVTGLNDMAGIQVGGSNTTLTIKGEGSLTATGGNLSAGIGLSRAWTVDASGGNIIIEGGNITANGGTQYGAGIGTGVCYGGDNEKTASLGYITIKGGKVKADLVYNGRKLKKNDIV